MCDGETGRKSNGYFVFGGKAGGVDYFGEGDVAKVVDETPVSDDVAVFYSVAVEDAFGGDVECLNVVLCVVVKDCVAVGEVHVVLLADGLAYPCFVMNAFAVELLGKLLDAVAKYWVRLCLVVG